MIQSQLQALNSSIAEPREVFNTKDSTHSLSCAQPHSISLHDVLVDRDRYN